MCDTCHEYHEATSEALANLKAEHETATTERAAIRSQIASLARDHEVHIAETHASLVTVDQAARDRQPILQAIDEIAIALMGPTRTVLQGGGRRDELGLISRMQHITDTQNEQMEFQNELKDRLANGGIKAKLTNPQRAALWASAVGGVFTVIAAIVSTFG